MKHIFYVHSNITYLASLGVIGHLQIPLIDVVIVGSSYKREKPVNVIDMNEFNGASILDKIKNYFYPYRRSDSFIKHIVKDDVFTLYIGWNNLDLRFMMTHPKCRAVNFIEEGLSAYWNNMTIKEIIYQRNPRQKIRSNFTLTGFFERLSDAITVFRGYNTAVQSIPNLYFQFCSDESVNYFGFDDTSFCMANKNKHIMEISEIINRFDFDEKELPNNSVVYISDYNPSSHSTFEDYTQELDSLSKYLTTNNIEKVYVKWHYRCNQTICKKLTDVLRMKFNGQIEIIPSQVVMEIVFLKSKQLVVLGNTSSLLFYSSIIGHNTFSLAKNRNLDYKNFWKKIKLVSDEY